MKDSLNSKLYTDEARINARTVYEENTGALENEIGDGWVHIRCCGCKQLSPSIYRYFFPHVYVRESNKEHYNLYDWFEEHKDCRPESKEPERLMGLPDFEFVVL